MPDCCTTPPRRASISASDRLRCNAAEHAAASSVVRSEANLCRATLSGESICSQTLATSSGSSRPLASHTESRDAIGSGLSRPVKCRWQAHKRSASGLTDSGSKRNGCATASRNVDSASTICDSATIKPSAIVVVGLWLLECSRPSFEQDNRLALRPWLRAAVLACPTFQPRSDREIIQSSRL